MTLILLVLLALGLSAHAGEPNDVRSTVLKELSSLHEIISADTHLVAADGGNHFIHDNKDLRIVACEQDKNDVLRNDSGCWDV